MSDDEDELIGFDPAERWSLTSQTLLYHGTSSVLLAAIQRDGVLPNSYWGTERVARFFADRTRSEYGGSEIVLSVRLADLDAGRLLVDEQMIEFPIFPDYDERQREWEENSEQGWAECLRLYESTIYQDPIPWVLLRQI